MNSSDTDFLLAFAAVAVIGGVFATIAHFRTRRLKAEQKAANNARAVALFVLVRNGGMALLVSLGIGWSALGMEAGNEMKPAALVLAVAAIAASLWYLLRGWRAYAEATRMAREARHK